MWCKGLTITLMHFNMAIDRIVKHFKLNTEYGLPEAWLWIWTGRLGKFADEVEGGAVWGIGIDMGALADDWYVVSAVCKAVIASNKSWLFWKTSIWN